MTVYIVLGICGLFALFLIIYYAVKSAINDSGAIILLRQIRDALKSNLQTCPKCDRYYSVQDKECPYCKDEEPSI